MEAEEQSILSAATLGSYNLLLPWTWNELALIDGSFKTMFHATKNTNGDGS